MRTYGTPGEHADQLVDQRRTARRRQQTTFVVGGYVLAILIGSIGSGLTLEAVFGDASLKQAAIGSVGWALWAAVIVDAYRGFRTDRQATFTRLLRRLAGGRLGRKVGQAKAGARSERRVADAIKKVQPEAVVHGAMLGAGGDLDHAVLGPMVAAIETKTGRGAVTRIRGDLAVAGRPIAGRPLEQVARQAAALRRHVGRKQVAKMVVVTDGTNTPLTIDGTVVVNVDQLPAALARLPDQISSRKARRVGAKLDPDRGSNLLSWMVDS